jgi:hypothetical protein
LQFEVSQENHSVRPYLKETLHKKGLVKWLKVKALSSNPSTEKKIACNTWSGEGT